METTNKCGAVNAPKTDEQTILELMKQIDEQKARADMYSTWYSRECEKVKLLTRYVENISDTASLIADRAKNL